MCIARERKPHASNGRLQAALRRFGRNRDGAAAIEFAMLAMPFMLLVFAILETCLSFAAQQVLSNAMDDVAREVRTGQIRTINQAELKEAFCEKIDVIVTSGCPGLEVDLRSYTSFRLAAADSYAVRNGDIFIERGGALLPLAASPGSALSINTMRVFYKWPVLTDIMRKYVANVGDSQTLLFATVTWQNEPYEEQ